MKYLNKRWLLPRIVIIVLTFVAIYFLYGPGESMPYSAANTEAFAIEVIPVPAAETILASEADKHWLALNIVHEARGELLEGQIAVTYVVLNRVRSRNFPNKIVHVIKDGGEARHKCQFSWYCDGLRDAPPTKASYAKAKKIVEKVLAGNYADNTFGATHYLNPFKVLKRKARLPNWACDIAFAMIVGNHFFYKDVSRCPRVARN